MCNKCEGRTSRRRVFFWNPIWPGVRGESGRNERLDAGKRMFERLIAGLFSMHSCINQPIENIKPPGKRRVTRL